MKNKLLSVIVPVYNKQDMLNQCLNSFCVEEMEEYLEVIVIDDGSCDGSKQIIEGFVNRMPHVFRGIYKENGGVGSVINLGIRLANGKYMKEVDADDWVDTSALKKLLEFLKYTETDMVLNPYQEVNEFGKREQECYFLGFRFRKTYPIEQIIKRTAISIQTFTIKSDIVKRRENFLSEQRYYIDMQLVEESILHSKTCVVLSDSLYRYRVGQTQQSVSINNYIKHRECFYHETMLSLDRLDRAVELGCSEEKINYQRNMCYMYVVYLYGISFLDKDVTLNELDQIIKEKNPGIYEELDKVDFINDFHLNIFLPECVHRDKFINKFSEVIKDNNGAASISLIWKVNYNDNATQELTPDKYFLYYSLINQWMYNWEQGMEVSNYFKKNNYYNIAIYGMKDFGVHLLEQLKNSLVRVVYGIDKSDQIILPADCSDFEIKKPSDELAKVDVIVITVLNEFEEIRKSLMKKVECMVVSLEEVICEC